VSADPEATAMLDDALGLADALIGERWTDWVGCDPATAPSCASWWTVYDRAAAVDAVIVVRDGTAARCLLAGRSAADCGSPTLAPTTTPYSGFDEATGYWM